jgi:C-terminal processing protease CtpA/Prc
MKMKRYLYFAFLTTISISCEKVLINEEISNNQQKVFEILWNDFDRNYAGFTVRNIDWDSVYNTTMDTINIGISEDNFQKIVIDILLSFKDIHVGFVNPNGVQVVYNATNPNSSNRIVSIDRYIDSPSENRIFKWGQITNENIGYIHIKTFNESLFLDFRQIDALISQFSTTDGLILDVRDNGGGAPASAYLVASRFIDSSIIAIKTRFRNGSNHNDFDAPLLLTIEPKGPVQYLKPVVILMNKSSQSAAELFILPLEVQGNITTVGDFSAGGLGLNTYRELPNGWNYRLTTTLTSNKDDEVFEALGIPPHVLVYITKTDSINMVDTQLERAIEILK